MPFSWQTHAGFGNRAQEDPPGHHAQRLACARLYKGALVFKGLLKSLMTDVIPLD